MQAARHGRRARRRRERVPRQLPARQPRRRRTQGRRLPAASPQPHERFVRRVAHRAHRRQRQPSDRSHQARRGPRGRYFPRHPFAAAIRTRRRPPPSPRSAPATARRPRKTWSGRSTTRWISFSITDMRATLSSAARTGRGAPSSRPPAASPLRSSPNATRAPMSSGAPASPRATPPRTSSSSCSPARPATPTPSTSKWRRASRRTLSSPRPSTASSGPPASCPSWPPRLPDIAIVRSMRAWALVHSLAQTWTQIGRSPAAALGNIAPNIGSIVAIEKDRERLPSQIFPTFLALNSGGAAGAGYLSSQFGPFKVTPSTGGIANTTQPRRPGRASTHAGACCTSLTTPCAWTRPSASRPRITKASTRPPAA